MLKGLYKSFFKILNYLMLKLSFALRRLGEVINFSDKLVDIVVENWGGATNVVMLLNVLPL